MRNADFSIARYERPFCDRSIDWETAAVAARHSVVQNGVEGLSLLVGLFE